MKLLIREPDTSFYADLVDGQVVWTSQLTLTESCSALLRKERERAISPSHRRRAWRQIEEDAAAHRINTVPLGVEVLTRATAILQECHPHVALRSLDAIQLASAERCRSWPLCANDARMRGAATLLGFPLTPLPGT